MSAEFNGTWAIDLEDSRVWDAASNRYVADEVGQEILRFDVHDGVQDYEVLYGDGPTVRMGYTAAYDSPSWAPYTVREILGVDGADTEQAIAGFKRRIKAESGTGSRRMELGKAYGLVRLVLIDDRTHYRIAKNDDGSPQSCLLRRLAEDGKSFTASVLDLDGVVFRVRTFRREG